MHYRRLGYRYTIERGVSAGWPLAALWSAERPNAGAQSAWRPPTDVYETASAFVVTIELAGISIESMETTLYENALVLEGHRKVRQRDAPVVYHSVEIWQGRFRVEVPLPGQIDYDRIEAEYELGLLRVVLPKAPCLRG